MANERAQNVIVVQAPVHYPLVIVSLGGCQNALIVVSELDEVHPISLRVVRVDLLSALEVVKTDTEVLAAGDQVLSIVADIHRVNLLLKIFEDQGGFQRLYHMICQLKGGV